MLFCKLKSWSSFTVPAIPYLVIPCCRHRDPGKRNSSMLAPPLTSGCISGSEGSLSPSRAGSGVGESPPCECRWLPLQAEPPCPSRGRVCMMRMKVWRLSAAGWHIEEQLVDRVSDCCQSRHLLRGCQLARCLWRLHAQG